VTQISPGILVVELASNDLGHTREHGRAGMNKHAAVTARRASRKPHCNVSVVFPIVAVGANVARMLSSRFPLQTRMPPSANAQIRSVSRPTSTAPLSSHPITTVKQQHDIIGGPSGTTQVGSSAAMSSMPALAVS